MADQVELVQTAESEEPSAEKRIAWLFHHTRAWLIVLGLLVVGLLVAGVSYAAFTSTSANAGNVVASGSIVIDDDLDNAAVLQISGIVPGDSVPSSVTISNVGESSGDFSLKQSALVDTPGPNGGKLSSVLRLRIVMDGDTVLFDGAFTASGTLPLGTWAPDESHSFDFVVDFPHGGNDNTFQQSQVSTTYVWDAITG